MKICVAQIRPIKGDFLENKAKHINLLDVALSLDPDLVIFPELSMTGYEPKLAHQLAIEPNDPSLDEFQKISNKHKIVIGIGLPTQSAEGICISNIFFVPFQVRQTYSKKYLHPDEEPYFIIGQNVGFIEYGGMKIAPAICYELSISEHAANANNSGAEIYLVNMSKSTSEAEKARTRLVEISRKYSMMVYASNNVGQCDNFLGGGKSSAWNRQGQLLGQLDEVNEGILCVDTMSQKMITKLI